MIKEIIEAAIVDMADKMIRSLDELFVYRQIHELTNKNIDRAIDDLFNAYGAICYEFE